MESVMIDVSILLEISRIGRNRRKNLEISARSQWSRYSRWL